MGRLKLLISHTHMFLDIEADFLVLVTSPKMNLGGRVLILK